MSHATDGNIYAVGETSDGDAAFYSVDSDNDGAENFVMKIYPGIEGSAALKTLTQTGTNEQSVVGEMTSAADSNFFRFDAFNTDGIPVISCSDHGVVDSGFLSSPSIVVMAVEVITLIPATDVNDGGSPGTTDIPTSAFLRRAHL